MSGSRQFSLVDGFKVPQGAERDPRVLWTIQQLKARASKYRSGEVTVTPSWVQVWAYPRVMLPADIRTESSQEFLELVIEGLLATVNRYYVTPAASRLALPPGVEEAMKGLVQGSVIWTKATNAQGVVTPRRPDSIAFEASGDGKYLRWTCYWRSYDMMEAPDCVGGAVKMPAADADFYRLAFGIAADANAQAARG